jgi:hypothetical protein
MQQTKSILSFRVTAKVDGKSWMSKSTTLTANSESEAIDKAKSILYLTDEHDISVEPLIVHHISDKLTTDNYPYGRLKTTAYFNVEMNSKGCRTVFQTVNPKNGRLNNPKKSTYDFVILPATTTDGHFKSIGHLSFNGTEEINRGIHFVNDFYECFTTEQIKSIALNVIAMMKVNSKAQVIYCGTNWDDLKPYYESQIKALVDIAKTGDNLFLNALLDRDAIDSLKVPDYQPFKIKEVIN